MKVLIIGGLGFLGTHIAKQLTIQGHSVSILSRNLCKIESFISNPNINCIQGDANNKNILEQSLKGQNCCIHLALGWGNTPTEMLINDTLMSVQIFELAVKLNLKKIIYTSSVSAFGELRIEMTEHAALKPTDLYGATKAASEVYLNAISRQNDIYCNIIRPCYTFGNPIEPDAPMEPDNRIRNFVHQALSGENINLITGDGTQMMPVEELGKIFAYCVNSTNAPKVINAGSEQYILWKDVAQMIINSTNSKSRIIEENKNWEPGKYIYNCKTIQNIVDLHLNLNNYLKSHIDYIIKNHHKIFSANY